MSSDLPSIAQVKNQWLFEQIDVEFPTKESIAGREIYKAGLEKSRYVTPQFTASDVFNQDDLFIVDFHRLTIMFSLLQSKRWSEQSDQELIIEFLTQIIYSKPCDLVVGFENGEPVAAAIVTCHGNEVLVSDVVVAKGDSNSYERFVRGLLEKFSAQTASAQNIYIEEQ
jgi:hypothetical protein